MKTAVIYNAEKIHYFVVYEDLTGYNDVYIGTGRSPDLEEQLTNYMYFPDGQYKQEDLDLAEFAEEIRGGAVLIECGMVL